MNDKKLKETLKKSFNQNKTDRKIEFDLINSQIDYERFVKSSENQLGLRFTFKPLLLTVLIVCLLLVTFVVNKNNVDTSNLNENSQPPKTGTNSQIENPGNGKIVLSEDIKSKFLNIEFLTLEKQLNDEFISNDDNFYNIEITNENNYYNCLYLTNEKYDIYYQYLNSIETLDYQKNEFYKLDFYNLLVSENIFKANKGDLIYIEYQNSNDILAKLENHTLIMVNLIKNACILNDLSNDLNIDTNISFDYDFKINDNKVVIKNSILKKIPNQILVKGKSIDNEKFIKTNSLNDLIVDLDSSFYYILEAGDSLICIENTSYYTYSDFTLSGAVKPNISVGNHNIVKFYEYDILINMLNEKINKLRKE